MVKKVLLCDDEFPILKAAEFKLKRAGFHVRCAGDGEAAWAIVCEDPPHLIVSDYQMPRVDGIQLLTRLRSSAATKDIPFILLTGKGFELDRDELVKTLNATEVLAKPFSPRDLLERVISILGEPSLAETRMS
ncbi:MAG: response regulator [Thermogutta sp.]